MDKWKRIKKENEVIELLKNNIRKTMDFDGDPLDCIESVSFGKVAQQIVEHFEKEVIATKQ